MIADARLGLFHDLFQIAKALWRIREKAQAVNVEVILARECGFMIGNRIFPGGLQVIKAVRQVKDIRPFLYSLRGVCFGSARLVWVVVFTHQAVHPIHFQFFPVRDTRFHRRPRTKDKAEASVFLVRSPNQVCQRFHREAFNRAVIRLLFRSPNRFRILRSFSCCRRGSFFLRHVLTHFLVFAIF